MKELIAEMDKSVRCLALELPEAVHVDVSKKWQALKMEIEKYAICPAFNEGKPCGWSGHSMQTCGAIPCWDVNKQHQ